MSPMMSGDVHCEMGMYEWISPDLYIVPAVAACIVCLFVSAGTLYELILNTCFTSEKKNSFSAAKIGRLLQCFSAYSNTKKVLDTRQLPGQLPMLDGIRVLSALWIIFGHFDFYADAAANIGNRAEHGVRGQERWFAVLDAYDLAVDTFIILGY
ncbi:nose resistant to fluoxetine protein 6-like [Branchiostoma floridae x Branchiostoma japonicum]